MNAQEKYERELAAFLAGEGTELDALYRKLTKPEPDNKLDSAVLALAQRALGAHGVATAAPATSTTHEGFSRNRRRSVPSRWVIGLGSAAGLVLAAGLAWRVGTHPSNRLGENAFPTAPPPAVVEKADSKTNVVEVNPINANEDNPTGAKTPSNSAPAATTNPPGSEEKRLTPPAAVPLKSPTTQAEARPRDTAGLTGTASSSGAAKPAPPPAPPAPIKQEKTAGPPHEPQAFPEVTQRAKASAPSSHAPANDAANASATGEGRQRDELDKSVNAYSTASPKASPPAESAVTIEAAPPAAASLEQTDAEKSNALEPTRWIAQIRKLLRDHHRDEAVMNLKHFREHYPDYPLPADLRDLVK